MEKGSEQKVVCPGCGLKLDNQHSKMLVGYNASAECYQKYSGLSGYTIGKQENDFIHQHAIDTFIKFAASPSN